MSEAKEAPIETPAVDTIQRLEPVTVATRNGPRTVDGEVFGVWAITPRLRPQGADINYWTFTHVPTGRSFGGKAFSSRGAVQSFVADVLAEKFSDDSWDTTDPTTVPEDEQKRFKDAYERFREAHL